MSVLYKGTHTFTEPIYAVLIYDEASNISPVKVYYYFWRKREIANNKNYPNPPQSNVECMAINTAVKYSWSKK